MRMLIIDESKTEQLFLGRLLSDMGITADMADDAGQAADYLGRFSYDGILFDRVTYHGLAEDFLKDLKPLAGDAVFAAMDSEADRNTQKKLYDAGFSHILRKPVESEDLFGMLKMDPNVLPDMMAKELLGKIPELSVEDGIRYCGSADALFQMVEIFYRGLTKKYDEIEAYWENEDLKNYTIKVHALKSSARLIGAAGLAGEAEALESAAKEDNIHFIRKNHGMMMEHLLKYRERFSSIFDGKDPATESSGNLPEILERDADGEDEADVLEWDADGEDEADVLEWDADGEDEADVLEWDADGEDTEILTTDGAKK